MQVISGIRTCAPLAPYPADLSRRSSKNEDGGLLLNKIYSRQERRSSTQTSNALPLTAQDDIVNNIAHDEGLRKTEKRDEDYEPSAQ